MINVFVYIPLILLVWIPILLYYWGVYKSLYWRRKKILSVHAIPLIGSIGSLLTFKRNWAEQFSDIYFDKSTRNAPFVGMHLFYKPAILIKDPELVRRVLVKDFSAFSNRQCTGDEHFDIIGSKSLFFVNNPAWKEIRSRLTPFFSSGKMKQMFHLMKEVATELNELLISMNINQQTQSFCTDVKDICARYTTDVIGTCAYGVSANSLKFPNGGFITCARKIFEFNPHRALEILSIFLFPEVVSLFRFKVFSKQSNDFLRESINHVIEEREKSGALRQDLIDALIDLKKEDKAGKSGLVGNVVFQGDVLVAQAASFFTAGFETSSSTMSFTLHELCWNPEIQKRLRAEIKKVLIQSKGDPTYEDIQNMKYLDMVILESLRMYPVLPFLDRVCTSNEGYSLEPFDNFIIPKGMPMVVSVYGLHKDPKYFHNPDTFDPERFSDENKKNIQPYTYMPFGLGPHACIGERFGLMQAKIGLVSFLKNHYVEPTDRTPKLLIMEKKALIIQAKDGIVLNVIRDQLYFNEN